MTNRSTHGVTSEAPRFRRPRSALALCAALLSVAPPALAAETPAPSFSIGAAVPLGVALVVVGVALGALIALSWERSARSRRASDEEATVSAVQRVMDSITEGFAIYGPDERLVAFNAAYRAFAGEVGNLIRPGISLEEMLRLVLERGLIEEARGREEAWLEERLARHRNPGEPFDICLNGRSLEVREVKQADGGTALFQIDLTEQKRAEAALIQSEQRYRAVVESQTELICRSLPDGEVTFVNGAYCRFFGGSPEQWVGKNYIDTMRPEDAAEERRHLAVLVADKRITANERRCINVSGLPRWIEWVDRPLVNAEGEVTEIQAVGHDITDRRSIQEALVRSEQRYRSVVNDQTEMICRFREDTVLTFVNDAYCRYFEMDRAALIGRPFLSLIPEAEHEGIRAHIAGLVESDEAQSYNHSVVAPKGELRWTQWTDRCFRDDQGRPVEFQSVGRDITKRMMVEERFRTFIENAPAAISVKDRDSRFVLVNRRFAEIVGLDQDEIVGRTPKDVFPTDFAQSGLDHDAEVVVSGRPSVREETLITERAPIRFLTVKFPLRSRSDEINGVAAIHTDISDLKRVEAELADAKEEAERANEEKTRFLSAASHDLRQPLHAMRLLLEALDSTRDEARRDEILQQTNSALSSMNTMLNTLLDIGELESGAVVPKVTDFAIGDVLDPLIDALRLSAREKGLALDYVRSSAVVRTDPTLLSRVLDNFLSNALRYTDAGRILVGCRLGAGFVRIEVLDTGPGIPESQLEAIFEDYRQLGNPGRDRSQGLGLGLGIVDRLVRLLGLRVRVASRVGKGSRFAVEAPMGILRAADVRPALPETHERLGEPSRILVVEDDPLVAEAARGLLASWGMEVAVAMNGEGAMEAAAALSGEPDTVVADYRLPDGETGLAVIETLRARFGAKLPAIVITGDISPSLQSEALEADCLLLRKPVEPARLRSLLKACGRQAQEWRQAGSDTETEPPSGPGGAAPTDRAELTRGLR